MAVSADNKTIAKTTAGIFGGNPRVIEYLNADETSRIGVLHSADRPEKGLTSYATIGLSDLSLPRDIDPPLGVEFLGVAESDYPYAEVLSTAAFFVMNDGWEPEPGACFRDIVRMQIPDTELPHLYFTDPSVYWDQEFASRVIGEKTVAWLLAIPISEAEAEYALENGGDALESLFEENEIDITDLERDSVL
jgi:antitoxin YqcF